MANVEELLATMSEPAQPDRVILTIDEDLRIVTVPSVALVIGAEGDKDVNRIWFKMNRNYRGTDLRGFVPKVNYINAAGKSYYYRCTDAAVEEDSILFSWLISDKAAEERGTVEFSVCMQLQSGTTVVKEFNTTTATMQCMRSIHERGATNDAVSEGGYMILGSGALGEAVLGG